MKWLYAIYIDAKCVTPLAHLQAHYCGGFLHNAFLEKQGRVSFVAIQSVRDLSLACRKFLLRVRWRIS